MFCLILYDFKINRLFANYQPTFLDYLAVDPTEAFNTPLLRLTTCIVFVEVVNTPLKSCSNTYPKHSWQH